MRAYYEATLEKFLKAETENILGTLSNAHYQKLEHQQTIAWKGQIQCLKEQLKNFKDGKLYFEFIIPRMGKRADCIILIGNCIFVLEFKVGAENFDRSALDQVHDYALDLKNFHLGSHNLEIFPILIATEAKDIEPKKVELAKDFVASPLCSSANQLRSTIDGILIDFGKKIEEFCLETEKWENSGYMPTPTIIEAAQALYKSHSVNEIARYDAGAKNLAKTTQEIFSIIENSKKLKKKSICFVTGVPGAGKTLAGLNIATSRSEFTDENAVFLSGNGPLVDVLREALARDRVEEKKLKKKTAEREVRSFILNIHHFRDEYFANSNAPVEKVVIFDEAQRAWSKKQATKFMTGKWGDGYSPQSEPEFLTSIMDRHKDWCCIICLIGGGQEINTGEAGIIEWFNALDSFVEDWDVYVSQVLTDPHYTIDKAAVEKLWSPNFVKSDFLHLSTSMRSFRAETVSSFVSEVINCDSAKAEQFYKELSSKYSIKMTRKLSKARLWLRDNARGNERTGLVASAGAQRLRPEGIFIKSEIDATNWFLNKKSDVRSSYYLEDVATQFHVQGLELDWVGLCWDADLRIEDQKWKTYRFIGSKWQNIHSPDKQTYLLNAYRVLLTRARQGMVIFIPEGNLNDPTRPPSYYDGTFNFLRDCGIGSLD